MADNIVSDCPTCNGSGGVETTAEVNKAWRTFNPCEECNATGKVRLKDCPEVDCCNGYRMLTLNPDGGCRCETCGGLGKIVDKEHGGE